MTIVRRNFLIGTGGAMLAIPLLESLAPRTAHAQARPPKRLIVVLHENGRMVGGRSPMAAGDPPRLDLWSPGPTSRALSVGTAPSELLAGLAPIANEIVTVDGVDHIVRHAGADATEMHGDAIRSCLTCIPSRDGLAGASFDYIVGERLRSGSSMRASVVISMSATPSGESFGEPRAAGPGGTDPTYISGNPQMAVGELFGSFVPDSDPDPTPTRPTLQERLQLSRGRLLDGVRESLQSLRGRVSARDRERLDRHAQFITETQGLFGGGGPVSMARGCTRPDPSTMPHVVPQDWPEQERVGRLPDWEHGRRDDVTTPHQIENIVQALACDVIRTCVVTLSRNPTFAPAFGGPMEGPFQVDDSAHQAGHGTPLRGGDADEKITNLTRGFQIYAGQFTRLIQRLAEIEDADGSRLLDNTMVLWMSELGYGADHTSNNIPIVLAGMRDTFSGGQGRHVVMNRRTTGDLFAEVMRKLGGTDTTFGATGTLGALASANGVTNLQEVRGEPGVITRDTPLHMGPLDL